MLAIRRRSDWVLYALFQYFWILVILPKFVQTACLGALLCLIWFRFFEQRPLDKFTIAQVFFLLLYGVSILINTLTASHELSRILAALNTWIITAIAVGFYHFYRHADIDLSRVGKYSLCNLLILVLLWVVYVLTGGARPFPVLQHTLMIEDWINGVYDPRFLGYMDYANLVVFFILFFYPLAMIYLRGKKLLPLVLTLALYLVIDATNSRTGQLLYLLLLMAYFLFEIQSRFFRLYKQRKFALLLLGSILMVAVVGLYSSQILRIFESIMNMREGSNNMRIQIYTQSITTMLERSPIIGIGIKDMLGEYPLGSHSTYIGVFYKTGILGGLIYLCSLIYLAIKILLGKDLNRHMVTAKICITAVLLLLVLEDIDGANWNICIFYILLALLQNRTTSFCSNKSFEDINYE